MDRAFGVLFLACLAALTLLTNGCGGGDSSSEESVTAPVLVAPGPVDGRVVLPFRPLGDRNVADDVADQIGTNILYTSRPAYRDSLRRIQTRFGRDDVTALEELGNKLHWGQESLLLVVYGGNSCVTRNIEQIVYRSESRKVSVALSLHDFGSGIDYSGIVDRVSGRPLPSCGKPCGFIDVTIVAAVAIPAVDTNSAERELVPTSAVWEAQSCRATTDAR